MERWLNKCMQEFLINEHERVKKKSSNLSSQCFCLIWTIDWLFLPLSFSLLTDAALWMNYTEPVMTGRERDNLLMILANMVRANKSQSVLRTDSVGSLPGKYLKPISCTINRLMGDEEGWCSHTHIHRYTQEKNKPCASYTRPDFNQSTGLKNNFKPSESSDHLSHAKWQTHLS